MRKLITTATLCLSLTLFTGGCTGFFIGEENLAEPVDLPAASGQIQFTRRWQHQVGDGTDGKALHLRPAIVGGRVFAVSADSELAAFELDSGSRLWQRDIGHPIAAGVGADDNLVVVGNENGLLLAFDANNGEAGWTYQMSTEVLTPPIIAGGLVIARAIDGQVTALDAQSGEVVWKQYIGVADLSIRGNARGLLLDGGVVLFTNGKGRLTILSAVDGQPLLATPIISGEGMTSVERIADLLATPTIRNGVLFVSAYRHKTLAINLKDGSLVWESPYATASDLFADNHYLYLIDKNSLISAVDINNGKLAWTGNALEGRRISPLVGNGQWIATVDYEGEMSIMDARSGKVLGHQRVGGDRAYVAPMPAGRSALLSFTADGDLSLVEVGAQ